MVIADMGSGNTSLNDYNYIRKMIDAIAKVDPERKFILKWQLFKSASPNISLLPECFEYAYKYAENLGYKTTASVFDKESLDFLLQFDIPFVKIANRPDLYWLIGEIPRKISAVISWNKLWMSDIPNFIKNKDHILYCVSKYPANIKEYEHYPKVGFSISDHTTSWDLFLKYIPETYEFHFCLNHDEKNPDGGLFARTPEQISEVYDLL